MKLENAIYMGVSAMDRKINDFVIFCLEYYKQKNNLTGKEVYNIFEKYDVFEYLSEGYDVLHTQGKDWLMNDIEEFLKVSIKTTTT